VAPVVCVVGGTAAGNVAASLDVEAELAAALGKLGKVLVFAALLELTGIAVSAGYSRCHVTKFSHNRKPTAAHKKRRLLSMRTVASVIVVRSGNGICGLRHRVVAAGMPGMTTRNAFSAQPQALQRAVLF